jgi:predicted phosphodiesterase
MTQFAIQIFSDIHLEFPLTFSKMPKLEPKAKICCLLGDICTLQKKSEYEKFLVEYCPHYEQVLVLLGNHEFYHGDYESVKLEWRNFLMEQMKEKHQITNIKLLDCDTFDVPEHNIRFLGATMWTHVSDETATDVQKTIKDYVAVKNNGIKITVQDTNTWHEREITWLKEQLEQAQQSNQSVIVLTHHAPTHKKTSSPEFSSTNHDKVKQAFARDELEELMKQYSSVIKCWCFGHTHYNSDQKLYGVRVVSNQLGYFMRGKLFEWSCLYLL